MGSRLEANSSAVRQRIEKHKFKGEDGEEYNASKFGGFNDYFRRKKIKLQNLDAERRAISSDKPPIFRAIVAHVNGYTQPSLNDLHTLIVSYGGGFMQYLDGKTTVTHIIASSLTPKKKVEFSKYRIVKPAWIVDSIEAGKLLPWDSYRVVDEGVGQQILGFDNGNVISQANRSQLGYKDQTNTSWYTGQVQELASRLNNQADDVASGSGTIRRHESEVRDSGAVKVSNDRAVRPTSEGSLADICSRSRSPTQSHDEDQFGPPSDLDDLQENRNRGTVDLPQLLLTDQEIPPAFGDSNENIASAESPGVLDGPQVDIDCFIPQRKPSVSPSRLIGNEAVQTQDDLNGILPSPKSAQPKVSPEEHNAYLLADPKIWKSTVVNPGFLKQYYEESRLHHLSAWKADLKSRLQALAGEKSSSQNIRQKRPRGSRRYILHVDFDSFFAAVSLKKFPQYVDKPVVVAHGGGSGSEIASCNYPARKYGIKNGMWMKHAQKLCSELKVLPYDFKAYEEASRRFYDAIMATGGIVQSVSVDEALVDVSSACADAGGIHEGSIWREQTKADEIAQRLRDTIKETTGCAVSVGIGENILLAKVALRKAKPAGQYHIKPEEVFEVIGGLTVQELPGVAFSIGGKLEEIGVKLVGDVRSLTKERLMSTLGPKTGEKIWDYSRGIDKVEVGEQVIRKSVSAEVNWGIRFVTQEQANEFVQSLCEELHKRLATEKVKGRQLTMKIMRRAADAPLDPPKHLGHGKCDTFNKSVVLGVTTNEKEILSREAISIMHGWGFSPGELRGIGVQMTQLEPLKGSAGSPVASSQRRLQFTTSATRNATPLPNETIDEIATPEKPRTQTQHPAAALAPVVSPSGKRRLSLNTYGTQFVLPSQVDPTILAELPEDIKSKLMGIQVHDSHEYKTFASTPPKSRPVSPSFAVNNFPPHSQLDNGALEALPEDVRAEVLALYKKSPRKPNAQTRLPQSPHKNRIINTKKPITPTRNKKRTGFLSRIKGEVSASTLTQSKFVASKAHVAKSKSDDDKTADAAEISDDFLSALPAEIRGEVLAQMRRDRLQKRGGIDLSNSKKIKRNQPLQTANTSQRRIRLTPRPAKPTFTSKKLCELSELRGAVDEWYGEFAGEGPYDEDVDVLIEYLRKVIQEEQNMAKAVGLGRWLAWVVEEAERANEGRELTRGIERWKSTLHKVREALAPNLRKTLERGHETYRVASRLPNYISYEYDSSRHYPREMSSPTSRRSQRNFASATPARSTRSNRTTQPNGSDAIPRASQQNNFPPSSPLFFNSSPASGATNTNRVNATNDLNSQSETRKIGISSPLRYMSVTGSTPRGGGQAPGESSPIHYASSSSPTRVMSGNVPHDMDDTNSSSGLFIRSSRSTGGGASALNNSRRGDIHSDVFSSLPSRRRRLIVDENGLPVRDGAPNSDANTFSNLDPNTSEADAIGGSSTRVIWGTNISIQDTMSTFKEFLLGYQKKYRMWADGATEEETSQPENGGTEREYVEMLTTMRHLGVTGLNLDVRNLRAFPSTIKLWHQLQAYPHEIVPLMDQAIKDIIVDQAEEEMNRLRAAQQQSRGNLRPDNSMPAVPSSDANGSLDQAQPIPDLVMEAETKVYKVKPFGLERSVNMRELNPNDMDKMISIKGLVIRTTPVIPDMKTAFFRCQVCNHAVHVSLDRGKIAEPTRCPRQACESQNSMQIVHNRCEFADKQIIKLQETPDNVPDGQTPHSVSLCAYEELVDVCKAGDRVEVTGIFRSNPVRINPRQRTIKALFKTYIDVLHIQKVDKRRLGIDVSTIEQELSEQVAGEVQETRQITEDEELKIKATAARGDVYELLSRSLAPSVYEMDDVKKGILLQLFGGTNKSFEKGGSPKYRGDINVLLCGDPSTSKSQLLQYVHKIAPRGVYTSGKGSSAVGLTAYVSRDPETRQVVLESGALVLSDGGVCCIDEFDKMSDSTRSVLHEVMEQQTVSIAKAGIITTLNARTSILASANPIGSKYNTNLPVPQNIDLPPTLLSRFDLVYLILDRIDEQNDRRLARHLVGMYLEDAPDNGSNQEILPVEFLTSYISYARTKCQPRITQAASDELVRSYIEMRKLGEDVRAAERRITATTRQLESMIRLGEAHAKMRLSDEVTANDVSEAVRLIKSALKQAATDSRTGLIDMGLLTEGTSASERRRRADLKKAITDLLDDMTRQGGAARYSEVFRRISEQGSAQVEGVEFADALRSLEQEGQVSVSGEGPRRNIRRVTGVV